MKKNFFVFICLLLTLPLFTQAQESKEKIEKAVTDYFHLERENIYVQCNKSVYISNEDVWFKGYVYHRKKNLPFYTTINVYASLMDETGKVLETKLLYANIGSFSGSFKLGDKLASGHYYIQFYTNWMNNFKEDESAVAQFTIINQKTGAGTALTAADLSRLNITLAPEGGNLIAGVTNIVGVRVADCNNEATPISTADIVDNKGSVLKKIQLNKLGYGRFDIIPAMGETYKLVATLEDQKHESSLPPAMASGVALEINNLTSADKTSITVRPAGNAASRYKSLVLLVHKDGAQNIYDIDLSTGKEVKFAIANNDLAEGVNTFRLLDKDFNEIAQRVVFKYPSTTLASTFTKKTRGIISDEYSGKINYNGMLNLSVSVLPENTKAADEANDIYSSLWLLPYIENTEKSVGKYYFTTISRGKAYELDLFLLCHKSKYQWQDVMNNPPKSTYNFDMGVTLKGTVPKNLVNKNAKVRMFSITGIDETTAMDENGIFYFSNLIIADSTHINLTVINKGNTPKEFNIKPYIVNPIKQYNKMYRPVPRCTVRNDNATPVAGTDALQLPELTPEAILLEETIIENKRLKYEKSFGNGRLTGYKITDKETNAYHTVLQYIISRGGFHVEQDYMGQGIHIFSRARNSIKAGQSEPIIYINNMQLLDHSQLSIITLDEVDEIYMSSIALIPSIRNYNGAIKIYLKPASAYTGGKKKTTPDIVITNGFQRSQPFENIAYSSTISQGFQNFGVIDWNGDIMTDENGEFSIKIPKMGPKSVKLLIEGFSADGKLISEIKTLQIQ